MNTFRVVAAEKREEAAVAGRTFDLDHHLPKAAIVA
jgi:hypothetical protein